jgi:hypothetical protein
LDITEFVMTAAHLHGVHATSAETFTGPVPGSQLSVVRFPSADEAARIAVACMAEGLPARTYPAGTEGTPVVILHD